jgi:hypothetical protein
MCVFVFLAFDMLNCVVSCCCTYRIVVSLTVIILVIIGLIIAVLLWRKHKENERELDVSAVSNVDSVFIYIY